MLGTIRVVGLGPSDVSMMTARSVELLTQAKVARLRTRIHPAAEAFDQIDSYDHWYETADSFETLYSRIVEDLVALAQQHPDDELIYAVPGSPVVAEHTVELLLARTDVKTICEPAVSVIDVSCAALGIDPMARGLRIVDALGSTVPLRGPGPLLILQTYAPEVLATVADRLDPETQVTILHHLGLEDQQIATVSARMLPSFAAADHLTSLFVDGLRTAGEAMDDLVDFMRQLREECPWDQEQTHASLTRHLLEESYEALDAIESLVRAEQLGEDTSEFAAHVEEELGDVLFQVVFHAQLGSEEERFNFATIADTVRDKLTSRHPHVFGDVVVQDSNEVAQNWEQLKKKEKSRESVTDGIAWQLPSLTLFTKLLRKAALVDIASNTADEARDRAIQALTSLRLPSERAGDAESNAEVPQEWGDALSALVAAANWSGVDLEGVLRERALRLRDDIQNIEQQRPS